MAKTHAHLVVWVVAFLTVIISVSAFSGSNMLNKAKYVVKKAAGNVADATKDRVYVYAISAVKAAAGKMAKMDDRVDDFVDTMVMDQSALFNRDGEYAQNYRLQSRAKMARLSDAATDLFTNFSFRKLLDLFLNSKIKQYVLDLLPGPGDSVSEVILKLITILTITTPDNLAAIGEFIDFLRKIPIPNILVTTFRLDLIPNISTDTIVVIIALIMIVAGQVLLLNVIGGVLQVVNRFNFADNLT